MLPMNAIDLETLTAPKKARVEIIPLIDVIFFLLATFVLFTLSLSKIASLTVPLPATPDIVLPQDNVSIQASADDTYYWKRGDAAPEIISAAELRPRLEHYRQNAPTPRVFVRGDQRAKFGAAVKVLDLVRAVGIEQVSIETVTSPTGR
jgi:biopolymer transport protein ExbD